MRWTERGWRLQKRRGWVSGGCAATWTPRAGGRQQSPGTTVDKREDAPNCAMCDQSTAHPSSTSSPSLLPGSSFTTQTLPPGIAHHHASFLNVAYYPRTVNDMLSYHPTPSKPNHLVCLCFLPVLAHKTPHLHRPEIRIWEALLEFFWFTEVGVGKVEARWLISQHGTCHDKVSREGSGTRDGQWEG